MSPRRQPSNNRPKPRAPKLGQNFLADPAAAARIVDALGDVSTRTVIEIGPGKGALTEVLSSRTPRLIAIELDRVLAAQLRMKFATRHNVEIVEGDALAVDYASLVLRTPGPLRQMRPPTSERARVVGNIPYYITSDLLLRLFDFHEYFDQIVVMLQKEVADRVAARPGSRDYGLLSATTQLFARPEALFGLPPGAFSPPPSVHSAVVRLTIEPKAERLGVPAEEFVDFLKLSFGQKRKTLANNLKARYSDARIRAAIAAARIRPDVRAEAVPLEKMAAVFRALAEAPAPVRS